MSLSAGSDGSAYDGACDQCHASDPSGYVAEATVPHKGGVSGVGLTGKCKTCHDDVDPSQTPQYQDFHGLTQDATCGDCHESVLAFTESLVPSYHQVTLTDCSGPCHGQVEGLSVGAFHSNADDTDCEYCHDKSTEVSDLVLVPSMHKEGLSGCVDCHKDKGVSPALPSFHDDLDDAVCTDCHVRSIAPSDLVKIPDYHEDTLTGCMKCHENTTPGMPSFHYGLPDSACEDCHERE